MSDMMNAVPSEDREALQALAEIGAILDDGGREGLHGTAAVDPCATYRKLRPWLLGLLPFISRIPLYGKRIAGAIEVLMSIADRFCPS